MRFALSPVAPGLSMDAIIALFGWLDANVIGRVVLENGPIVVDTDLAIITLPATGGGADHVTPLLVDIPATLWAALVDDGALRCRAYEHAARGRECNQLIGDAGEHQHDDLPAWIFADLTDGTPPVGIVSTTPVAWSPTPPITHANVVDAMARLLNPGPPPTLPRYVVPGFPGRPLRPGDRVEVYELIDGAYRPTGEFLVADD